MSATLTVQIFLALSLLAHVPQAQAQDRVQSPAESGIDLIHTHYFKMMARRDLDQEIKDLNTRLYAEKVAALDTADYNQVMLELEWLFESRTDAMLPVTLLMIEVAAFSPEKPRISESENKITEVIDFAFKVWISVALLHSAHTTFKAGARQGIDAFWKSIWLSNRAKWISLGLTSAEAVAVACDLVFQKKKYDPLERLEKVSRRVLAVLTSDLNRSKEKWKQFTEPGGESDGKTFTPLQTTLWASELKSAQALCADWSRKAVLLGDISTSFQSRAYTAIQKELSTLMTELTKLHGLLQNAENRLEILTF